MCPLYPLCPLLRALAPELFPCVSPRYCVCPRVDPGLIIAAVGKHAQEFRYPAALDVPVLSVPIYHAPSRQQRLTEALPRVAATLAQGRNVVCHCNGSYHRGPALAAAIMARLCGAQPANFLPAVARVRKIWPGYRNPDFYSDVPRDIDDEGSRLMSAVRWAKSQLDVWTRSPRKKRCVSMPAHRAVRPALAGSGSASSQPTGFAGCPSTDDDFASVTEKFVYRCMRGDGDDLREPGPVVADDEEVSLRRQVCHFIGHGSQERSPWLHFSYRSEVARKFWVQGRQARRDLESYMVRLDLRVVRQIDVCDMSTQPLQKKFIGHFQSDPVIQDSKSARQEPVIHTLTAHSQ